jgi:hypothetical protein
MKTLTKVQTEAIVDEVQERLTSLSTPLSLPIKALKEWEVLKPLLIKRCDEELVNEKEGDRIDTIKNELREYELEISKDIKDMQEETEERLDNLGSFENVDSKDIDWAGINAKVKQRNTMVKTIESLQKSHEKTTDKWEEFDDELKEKIDVFEREYQLSVDYRWLDREAGEEPTVKFKIKDSKDKIRRLIAILSIDNKGPLTADDLIDTIVNRFATTSES